MASDRKEYIANCLLRFGAAVRPEWGKQPWHALAECIEIASRSGLEEAHQQLIALVDGVEDRARKEAQADA